MAVKACGTGFFMQYNVIIKRVFMMEYGRNCNNKRNPVILDGRSSPYHKCSRVVFLVCQHPENIKSFRRNKTSH